jgi:hypothetical protein
MLIYHTINWEDLYPKIEDVPIDWAITTDRRYFQQANLVVFHLPDLQYELENDLEKLDGQIWVSWYLESEKNLPLLNESELRDMFDLWVSYQQDEERKEHPMLRLCRNSSEIFIR